MFKLDKIEINKFPYPHCFVENFLDDEIFIDLKNSFPSSDWFSNGKFGDGRITSHTNRFNLSAGQYCPTNFDHFIDKKENKVWKSLYSKIKESEIREKIIKRFGDCLEQNGYVRSDFALPTFDITFQKDGYINPPHLDTAYHVFQMIIYLDTKKIISGGDITVWENTSKIHKSYKVKDNSAFIWLNTANSYHAAYPVLKGERKFIYIGFDSVLNSSWKSRAAPAWHFFDIKNARSPWRIYDLNSNKFI
jgi:hypothetical protein